MKINRLCIYDIENRPLLKGLNLYFGTRLNDNNASANCFIGVNGAGKSQVLEALSEIFLFMDNLYRVENPLPEKYLLSPFAFKIEYEIVFEEVLHLVVFECDKVGGKLKDVDFSIFIKNDEELQQIDISQISLINFIPAKITGYTSGANETLSLPFDSYYDHYAEYTWNRAKNINDTADHSKIDYDPRLYFMNYNTNLGITITSFIYRDDFPEFQLILDTLNINELKSFVITIQTLPPTRRNGGVIFTPELEEWRQKLINIADENIVDEKHQKNTLKFNITDETRIAFKDNFSSALELYTCLYKLELLNNLVVDKATREKLKKERADRKLLTKMPIVSDINKVMNYSELKLILNNKNRSEIDYLSLSDGEHQFLNVFGTLLMMNQDNCLFLLDEPETHFNPVWRRTFISTLERITHNRKQDIFITTHSPFIISDSKRENVFIFKKENEEIIVDNPSSETYGATFDNILKMAFEIVPPISENSLEEIKKLQHENDPNVIQEELENFGDSLEIATLRNRIILLKSKDQK
ncbi:restriction system-associated AAA family ATPase [Chryseobacterium cucumeris]|uniref:Restriction system-associated AAA family ATPase n=1 Tax=Chryseobacterium cucumeris TaxID=1813611 RepID=A0ABX9X7W3_9FLAO|nr:restriction system-associated AAA family ATPase [Chryseobacterium cucumeris]ROH91522.1 restriction system-associated AAA family ATPase [Chryseobacterium cucumeris]